MIGYGQMIYTDNVYMVVVCGKRLGLKVPDRNDQNMWWWCSGTDEYKINDIQIIFTRHPDNPYNKPRVASLIPDGELWEIQIKPELEDDDGIRRGLTFKEAMTLVDKELIT